MNISHLIRLTLAAAFLSTQVVGTARAAGIIKVDGSSTVYPITEAAAEEYQRSHGDTKVTVGISGTGGGFKKFCRGETDISNASRPISKKEIDACWEAGVQFVELPVAYDALTVVVSPKNPLESITVAQLKKMWEPAAQGVVTKWNQVDPSWPGQPLKLFGPGSDSGTFDYFTEAVNGKSKASRGDYTASEDDNTLVQGVSSDANALGYFGYAYYIENKDKLKAVKIDGGKGAVEPSDTTVSNGTYNPLSRPIFIYVSKKAMKRQEVRDFVKFYLQNAPQLVSEVKYIPLDAQAYGKITERFDKSQGGTAFGGKNSVGLSIHQVLSKKLAS
jgi:phosphate transport system substrate-binding protein